MQFIVGMHPFTGEGGDKSAPGLNASATPAGLGYAFFREFCLALKGEWGKESSIVWRSEGPDPFTRGELAPGNVKFMAKREGAGTNYEIAVPWMQLDTGLGAPPADKRLGFGIVVNDVNMEKGFKTDRQSMGAFGRLAAAPTVGVVELE